MVKKRLELDRFPRSKKYDFEFMCKNEMGPNSIWLMEFLTEKVDLKPGMRVLDLGCGMAMSSVFLAKEFDVEVWAADLWIDPSDNFKMIKKEGITDKVFPIKAEAHQLPFAEGFFDIILSVDAYHYFGTDELYFLYLSKFLKDNGQFGIVVPGLKEEINNKVPKELKEIWETEFFSFHSTKWWKEHFEKTGLVEINNADQLKNSWEIWMKWENELMKSGLAKRNGDSELLEADNGKYLTFPRIVATKI